MCAHAEPPRENGCGEPGSRSSSRCHDRKTGRVYATAIQTRRRMNQDVALTMVVASRFRMLLWLSKQDKSTVASRLFFFVDYVRKRTERPITEVDSRDDYARCRNLATYAVIRSRNASVATGVFREQKITRECK